MKKLIMITSYLFAVPLQAASVNILLSIDYRTLNDFNGNPLNAGSANDGDGAVLQLGYYTMATTLDPFAGDWVAMTGQGTSYLTTIGDSGDRGAGSFKTEVILLQGSYTFTEPPIGTPLALRFYDSNSIGASTYFNAVSDTTGGFNWLAPADPDALVGLGLSYLTAGVFWQDGSGSAFRTTIPIPEPSAFALLGILGLGGLMVRRRNGCG